MLSSVQGTEKPCQRVACPPAVSVRLIFNVTGLIACFVNQRASGA
jgi:hypothetical protein